MFLFRRFILLLTLNFAFLSSFSQVLDNVDRQTQAVDYSDVPDSLYVSLVQLEQDAWNLRYDDPVKAFNSALKALKIADEYSLHSDAAKLYNYIGVILMGFQFYDFAVDNFNVALFISQKYNIYREKAYALNNLGNVKMQQADYDDASQFLFAALDIFKNNNDFRGAAYSYFLVGCVFFEQKNYSLALDYYNKSLNIRRSINETDLALSAVIYKMIETYIKSGDLTTAGYYIQSTLQTAQKMKYKRSLPLLFYLKGLYHQSRNERDSMYISWQSSITSCDSLCEYEILKNVSNQLALAYYQDGNYVKSSHFYSLAVSYGDSIVYSSVIDATGNLKTKQTIAKLYSLFILDQQNQGQNSKNRIIIIITSVLFAIVLIFALIFLFHLRSHKRRKVSASSNEFSTDELIKSLEDRIEQYQDQCAVLSSKIEDNEKVQSRLHSFILYQIKNPLGCILDLCNKINDSQLSRDNVLTFETIKNLSSNIYLSFDNLMLHTRLQSGKVVCKREKINLGTLINKNLSSFIGQAAGKYVELKNLVADNFIVDADRFFLGIILKNLISNAVKFSTPEGEVSVDASVSNNSVLISVKDDGPGITSVDNDKDFASGIVDDQFLEKYSSGLGLLLCKDLVALHGGVLYISSSDPDGTVFSFTIPV